MKKYIAFCDFCDWTSENDNRNLLRIKLEYHLASKHIDIIMETWMNNQASRWVIKLEDKDKICFGCDMKIALCGCSYQKLWKCKKCDEPISNLIQKEEICNKCKYPRVYKT